MLLNFVCKKYRNALLKNDFRFDAVVLTTGATWPRDLPLKNRDLKGIHFAMEFLESGQKRLINPQVNNISAKGKHVIVIGE